MSFKPLTRLLPLVFAVSLGNWPRLAARARQRADRGR